MKLDELFTAFIEKRIPSPHYSKDHNIRLDRHEDFNGNVTHVIASRINGAPKQDEARVYVAYMRRAGWSVQEPEFVTIQANKLNEWIGRKWAVKKRQPAIIPNQPQLWVMDDVIKQEVE